MIIFRFFLFKDELELLIADDNTAESGLKHFSLKEIQKKEKMERKKKKWQKNMKKKLNCQEEVSFKVLHIFLYTYIVFIFYDLI